MQAGRDHVWRRRIVGGTADVAGATDPDDDLPEFPRLVRVVLVAGHQGAVQPMDQVEGEDAATGLSGLREEALQSDGVIADLGRPARGLF